MKKVWSLAFADYLVKVKAGKRATKFEDRMGGKEECRILSKCYRIKKKNSKREVPQEERVCQ
jgi:hypothetical protein